MTYKSIYSKAAIGRVNFLFLCVECDKVKYLVNDRSLKVIGLKISVVLHQVVNL